MQWTAYRSCHPEPRTVPPEPASRDSAMYQQDATVHRCCASVTHSNRTVLECWSIIMTSFTVFRWSFSGRGRSCWFSLASLLCLSALSGPAAPPTADGRRQKHPVLRRGVRHVSVVQIKMMQHCFYEWIVIKFLQNTTSVCFFCLNIMTCFHLHCLQNCSINTHVILLKWQVRFLSPCLPSDLQHVLKADQPSGS